MPSLGPLDLVLPNTTIIGWQNEHRHEAAPADVEPAPKNEISAREHRIVAAVLDLMVSMLAARNRHDACRRFTGELRDFLNARSVAIGLCTRGEKRVQVASISDVDGFRDVRTDSAEIEHRMRALLRDHHLRLKETNDDIAFPLTSSQGEAVAVCLIEWGRSELKAEATNLAVVARTRLGTALLALPARAIALDPLRRAIAKSREWRYLWTCLLAATLGAACWPIADPVYCDCRIEPLTRRHVAAPFAGVLEKTLVRPGEHVAQGDVLAILDGRDLRNELAQVQAECQRAAKARDIDLAAGKTGSAQIDKLEMERCDQRLRLLQRRLEQLEIKSPVDGVVVAGDLQRVEGAPLTIGQTLFEIAPLQQLCAELAIPDKDFEWVVPGQEVQVCIHGKPWESWSGTLEHLHPRAEIRDAHNVFIGEMTIENTHGELHPGLVGRATLFGNARPVGWVLIRNLIWRIGAWWS